MIAGHFQGEVTIGGYSAPPGRTKWLVFDFDAPDLRPVLHLKRVLRGRGAEGYIEFSGCKGWHLWVFLTDLEANNKVRMAGRALLRMAAVEGAEVFPKQDLVSLENPGNLIKFPLGVHKATGKRCLFVDENGKPFSDQFGLLEGVQKVSLDALVARLPVDLVKPLARTARRSLGCTPPIVKPCVLRLIEQGVQKGYRNEAGFLVALELRRIGAERATTAGVLAAWNLRCEPPLIRPELKAILYSAYGSAADYEFGCNWSGLLAEIMPKFCIGKKNCLYRDLLLEMNAESAGADERRQVGHEAGC